MATYAQVLNPNISMLGPDDPPHAYFARKNVNELGLMWLSELIADSIFGTDYSDMH